jgi:hypothetical protein
VTHPSDEDTRRRSHVRWHTDNRTCSHSNDDVCPTCDFDGYYASTYPAECPWSDQVTDEDTRPPTPDELAARYERTQGPMSQCECDDYELALRRGHTPGCPERGALLWAMSYTGLLLAALGVAGAIGGAM